MAHPSSTSRQMRFGEFSLDLETAELRKNGQQTTLQGQPFQILLLLLEQPGRLVTRDELKKKLWPSDTFGDFDHGLNKAVKRLREALEDSADQPKFIETLPRRGYRYIGDVAEDPSPKTQSTRPTRFRYLLVAALVVLGGFSYGAYHRLASPPIRALSSVAVLPFNNAMVDSNTEYLSDGISESLISSLSGLPNLIVRPRASASRYKSEEIDIRRVATELQADTIVTGRVMTQGDSLIVSVELIDTHGNRSLWSHRYENKLSDALTVQREINQEVAARLVDRLTGERKAKLNNGTNNPEAYELYLKGHYQWEKRTAASLSKAKEYYQQAIQKDPNYALAYVGLAEYFMALPDYAYRSVGETNADAKANALRALSIDELLPEAHAALATAYDNEWDPAAAREYERALELNPNNGRVHVLYGIYFSIRGNQERASQHLQRALELDPLDLNASDNLAITYYYSRQYERAIEQLKSLLQVEPNYPSAHANLSDIYRVMGEYNLWLEEWEKSARLSNDSEDLQLAKIVRLQYSKSGYRSAVKRLIALRQEQAKRIYVDPGSMALDYATLGDKDETFIWLEKAFAEKSPALSFCIKTDPKFDFIRSDPRYADLLHRMNLS